MLCSLQKGMPLVYERLNIGLHVFQLITGFKLRVLLELLFLRETSFK